MLTIRLFGYLEAMRGDSEPIRRFRSRTAAEVLALLSVSLPRVLPRDEVASIVWPEDETEQARQSLRTAISSLRKQLGVEGEDDWFTGDRHSIGLDARRVVTDLANFNRIVAEPNPPPARLRDAVALVRGPLLQGFEASWTVPHQIAFEETYSRAVVDLIEILTRDGSHSLAAEIGRAALLICPLREDVHVALIRSLGAAGKNAEALRQFEVLEQLLMDQWGEYPSDQAVLAIESLGRRAEPRPRRAPPGDEALALRTKNGWVFGREREVGEILMVLQDPGRSADRILTLIGAGGSGKTTIAKVVQESLSEVIPVAFTDLAPIKEVRLAIAAAAKALGLANPSGPDAVDRVRNHLASERVVLILDNAEHLPGIAKVVDMWCPPEGASRILVTSRSPLGLRRERLCPVPPLSVPSGHGTPAELAENPCVRLFVDRACLADPDFELTSQNARAVAEICASLDGVPLAIELAAAQVLVMSPAQILKRLGEERFRLKSPTADANDRHASIDRAAKWSYDLLSTEDQAAFRKLGIFRGDFSLEAAEAIVGSEASAEVLARLVRASLLERRSNGDVIRFRMLVPLRSVALECLDESGEELDVRTRHRDYFLGLAWRIRDVGNSPDPAPAFEALELERDHFRQIIDYAQSHRTWAVEAMSLAFAIGSIVTTIGDQFEWRDRLVSLVTWATRAEGVTDLQRALGLYAAAQSAGYALRADLAIDMLAEALPLFEKEGRAVDVAGCLNLFGLAYVFPNPSRQAQPERAIAALERAASVLDTVTEDSLWRADHLRVAVLANLAAAYRMQSRQEEAIPVLKEALVSAKRNGIHRFLPSILVALSEHHLETGRSDDGERFALQAIDTMRALGLPQGNGLCALGVAYQGQGRHLEAIRLFASDEFLATFRNDADTPGLILLRLALSAHYLERPDLRDLAHRTALRLGYGGFYGPIVDLPEELRETAVHVVDLKAHDPEVLDVYRTFRETFGVIDTGDGSLVPGSA